MAKTKFVETVIIKNIKTGHEQEIQKRAWEEVPHLYTGYRLAKPNEIEKFEKVEQPPQAEEAPKENEPNDLKWENPQEEEKPKSSRAKKKEDPEG